MKINNHLILGLDKMGQEEEMRYGGCGNCSNGELMGNVTKCQAMFKTKAMGWDSYEVYLCHGCLCTYYNADPLPEGCKNLYNL